MKRRGDDTSVKTKEQIRHLYYRTWAVVNKLLSGHGMIYNKSQELSAVINYGRLRCKFDGGLLIILFQDTIFILLLSYF